MNLHWCRLNGTILKNWHSYLEFQFCAFKVGESKTRLAIAANAKINVDTNFWIKVSSLSATLPSLLGDMMMGSWSDIFGKMMMMIKMMMMTMVHRHHHQVVDSPSSSPLLAVYLQLQSTSGIRKYNMIIIISSIILNIFTIIIIEIMVAFILSLVLVPSLPVSLLCLASLLR